MKNVTYPCQLFLFLCLIWQSTWAIDSAKTGDWSAETTWVGGASPNPIYSQSEDVVIKSNHTVTIQPVSPLSTMPLLITTVSSLTIDNGGILILANETDALHIKGSFDNYGSFYANTGSVIFVETDAKALRGNVTTFYNLGVRDSILTLSTSPIVTHELAMILGGGIAFGGTIKFSDADHKIIIDANKTLPNLNFSAATGSKTIVIESESSIAPPTPSNAPPALFTIESLILPTGTANSIALNSGNVQTTITVNSVSGGTCQNDSINVTTYPTTIAATKSLVCTPTIQNTTTPAPLFSIGGNAKILIEELKD